LKSVNIENSEIEKCDSDSINTVDIYVVKWSYALIDWLNNIE